MLEHLVKAREQGGAGPDGRSASTRRHDDDAKRNNGLEVGLPLPRIHTRKLVQGGAPCLYCATIFTLVNRT